MLTGILFPIFSCICSNLEKGSVPVSFMNRSKFLWGGPYFWTNFMVKFKICKPNPSRLGKLLVNGRKTKIQNARFSK